MHIIYKVESQLCSLLAAINQLWSVLFARKCNWLAENPLIICIMRHSQTHKLIEWPYCLSPILWLNVPTRKKATKINSLCNSTYWTKFRFSNTLINAPACSKSHTNCAKGIKYITSNFVTFGKFFYWNVVSWVRVRIKLKLISTAFWKRTQQLILNFLTNCPRNVQCLYCGTWLIYPQ